MNVPGSNLLSMALTVLGHTSVALFKEQPRTAPNAKGAYVTTYDAPITIDIGSVQAVPKNKYEELHLDWQKSYISWYVPNVNTHSLARGKAGDVIEVFGRRWQLQDGSDWIGIDGWIHMLGVDIGPATGALINE